MRSRRSVKRRSWWCGAWSESHRSSSEVERLAGKDATLKKVMSEVCGFT